MVRFKKKNGVDRKEDQVDVEVDPDEEQMEYVKLDYERECHWIMFFEDNDGGVDGKKALLHAKRWDVYVD